ncbi:MAG: hypothetical protein ACFFE4_17985 [Candidatus Thorarchaeota archaeon]
MTKKLTQDQLIQRAIYFEYLLSDANYDEVVKIRKQDNLAEFVNYCNGLKIPEEVADEIYNLSEFFRLRW